MFVPYAIAVILTIVWLCKQVGVDFRPRRRAGYVIRTRGEPKGERGE